MTESEEAERGGRSCSSSQRAFCLDAKELFDEFETLSKIYPTALKYQKMTVNAKAALLAGDLDLAWSISAQRSALT